MEGESMSKKRKRVRISVVKPRQKVQASVPEMRGEAMQQGVGLVFKAEYVLQQYYAVTVDERLIETKWLSHFAAEHRAQVQEDVARFQRMLKGIVADWKAFHAVCDYLVLAEQDSMGDGGTTYLVEHYEGEKSFVGVLVEQAHCFVPEDRAWLLSLVDCHGRMDFDLDLQVEGLQVAFHLETSGFHVGQHACVLEDI
jgi:hypothetical protein